MNTTRKVVDMVVWSWNPKVDGNVLFENMPYVMNRYRFIRKNPRYVLYSKHSQRKLISGKFVKIFLTSESISPKMNECDWAFGFNLEEEIRDDRYMRMPNYVRLGAGVNLIKPKSYSPVDILKSKRKFCTFIYSNRSANVRNEFFKRLSKYKKVDSPGKVFNNMPMIGGFKTTQELEYHLRNSMYKKYDMKVEFLRDYKFVISFENKEFLGYTSEKIYHAMLANCLPIYWGNPAINEDFNTGSFINYYDHGSMDAVIDRIVQLDKDHDLYMKCLAQPWYPNNRVTRYTDEDRILNRFRRIFG